MLTAMVVNSLADVVGADNAITLREALEAANTNTAVYDTPAGSSSAIDEITFDPALFADGKQTITLGGTQLSILGRVNIQGPGADLLAIDANRLSRVFYLDHYGPSSLSGLSISGGYAQDVDPNDSNDTLGGGLQVRYGTLSITESVIDGNETQGRGGGVYVYYYGDLILSNSTIENNVSATDGGGIFCYPDSTVTVVDSVLSENSAGGDGGAIFSWGDTSLSRSEFSNNTAGGYAGGIMIMTAALSVDACVFSDNSATGSSSYAGAIYTYQSATITNSTFVRNSAGFHGGAVYSSSDALDISDSTISDNAAEYGGGVYNSGTCNATRLIVSGNDAEYGGGIYNHGNLTVSGSSITGNSASSTSAFYGGGGGICNFGDASILDSSVTGNTAAATGYGGGIYNGITHTLSITGSTISGNSAGYGGGIENYRATVTVENSTFSDNHAILGGGIDNYGQDVTTVLTINGSAFSNNSATQRGGGVYNYRGKLCVNHSTFMGNSAAYDGGGVSCWTGDSAVANSTLVGNTASYYGGGIDNSGTLALTNSTIAGNLADDGGGVYCDGTLTVANSIIALNEAPSYPDLYGTVSAGTNNRIGADPEFVRDPDDGGDGWGDDPATTGVDESANDDYGDVHLAAGSPAINAGSNTWAVDAQGDPLVVDLDGNPRIVDGTVDVGAYEFSGLNVAARDDDYDDLAGGVSHVLNVLANDVYPPGAVVSVAIVEQPRWGTATANPDGTVTYTPYYALRRDDTFTYALLIDGAAADTADVSLMVLGGGSIPVSTTTDETDDDYSPGELSLREALLLAAELSGSNTITFDAGLNGQSIVLAQGELVVDSVVDVVGPGTDLLTIDAAAQSRVLHVAAGRTVSIAGVRITGGRAQGDGSNPADDSGGGILTESNSVLTLSGCLLTGNSAPRVGTSAAYGRGGAIASNGTLTILDSTLEGNSASGSGGAVEVGGYTGTILIRRTTLSANSAPFGGAIYNQKTTIIENSELVGNVARGMGNGGAINNQSGTLIVVNSIIADNAALFGAGILNFASLRTVNSTIAGNAATSVGGGIETSYGTATLANTIVAGNTTGGGGPDVFGTVTSLGYNLVGDTRSSGGFGATGDLLNVAPDFVRDPDDGGDGWGDNPATPGVDESANDDYGDLRLRPASPAIQAGSNALAVDALGNPLATDLDNKPRIIYTTVDIGAYEFRVAGDADYSDTVDEADASILGAHWLQSGADWGDGDFNDDGRVDDRDAAILAAHWGCSVTEVAAEGASNDPFPSEPVAPVRARFMGPVPAASAAAPRKPIQPAGSRQDARARSVGAMAAVSSSSQRAAAFDAVLEREYGPRPGQVTPQRGLLAWSHSVMQPNHSTRANSRPRISPLAVEMLLFDDQT